MRRSGRAYLLLTLFLFLAGPLVLSPPLAAQNPGQASAQNQQAINQQPTNQQPINQQPIAVQDLTPPADVDLERAAAEAEKAAAQQQAAANTSPAANPNDTVKVPAHPKKKDDGYTFRSETEEVMLYATVVDPRNRSVSELSKDAFTVFEDGVPQQITSFHREDIPVSLGILIDNSGTMRQKRPSVNRAALNLVKASNPQDEVFIVNFNDSDSIYIDQDFTSNVSLMKEALDKVEARGTTAIYDAVVASADHLSKGARREKKVLLVVTDGEDNASRDTLEEAVGAVQKENGPTVYAIGLLDPEGKSRKRARRALERMAIETGGVAYFPESFDQVDEISNSIAHDIRNQYTIGYKPSRPQSQGGFRNVRVEARGDGKTKLQVRTKSGYFAGQKNASGNSGQ